VSTLFGGRCSGSRASRWNERFIDERDPVTRDLPHRAQLRRLGAAHPTTPLVGTADWRRCVGSDCQGSVSTADRPQRRRRASARPRLIDAGLTLDGLNSDPESEESNETWRFQPLPVEREDRWPFQAQDQQSQDPKPPCRQLCAWTTRAQRLSSVRDLEVPHVVCPNCGWYKNRVALEVTELNCPSPFRDGWRLRSR